MDLVCELCEDNVVLLMRKVYIESELIGEFQTGICVTCAIDYRKESEDEPSADTDQDT